MPRRWRGGGHFVGLSPAGIVAASLALGACGAEPGAPGAGGQAAGGQGGSPAGGGLGGATVGAGGEAGAPLVPVGVPAPATPFDVWLGPTDMVYEPPPPELGSFPGLSAMDAVDASGASFKRVFLSVSQSEDIPSAPAKVLLLTSEDGGHSFPLAKKKTDPSAFNMIRLGGGDLLAVSTIPVFELGAKTATLVAHRSTDGGETWEKETATFEAPAPLAGLRFYRGILELPDEAGTLLLPYYTKYSGEPGRRAEIAESQDGGRTWKRRGTVAVGTASLEYNENTIALVLDGTLLSVLRTATGGTHGNLVFSRSADGGLTWSVPEDLLVAFGDAPAAPRRAVAPHLALLPNGALVLSAGREDNWIAVSKDGLGPPFERGQVTYVNYPTVPAGANRYHGSSGNTAIVPIDAQTLLLAGDNCANSWGCPPNEGGFTIDGKYRIWKRKVHVLGPDVGRIDLAGKLRAGRVSVDTNMTWKSPAHPETRPAAAFDGSAARHAGAVKEGGGEAFFTIELDRAYELTRLGLCLTPGRPARAKVYASGDGVTFPVLLVDTLADTGAQKGAALAYYALPPGVRARFVKVVPEPSGACGPALPSPCSALHEIELYATTNSFEAEALHAAPRGFENAEMAWITASDVDDSRQALRIKDGSESAQARIEKRSTGSAKKLLEFRARPVALASAFLFGLTGTSASGDAVSVYRLGVFPDGSMKRYDVASSSWMAVSGPGAVKPEAFSTIRIEASTSDASLFIDGKAVATLSPSAPGATELSGYVFASGGTAPKGDDIVIDDVLFEDGP